MIVIVIVSFCVRQMAETILHEVAGRPHGPLQLYSCIPGRNSYSRTSEYSRRVRRYERPTSMHSIRSRTYYPIHLSTHVSVLDVDTDFSCRATCAGCVAALMACSYQGLWGQQMIT